MEGAESDMLASLTGGEIQVYDTARYVPYGINMCLSYAELACGRQDIFSLKDKGLKTWGSSSPAAHSEGADSGRHNALDPQLSVSEGACSFSWLLMHSRLVQLGQIV